MANGNTIVVSGNLTSDPELKFTASGKQLVNFTIANNRRYKKGDDWEEAVAFLNCVLWGEPAEYFSASCQKGDRVVVQGRIDQDTWETEDGSKRSALKINVEEVSVSLKSATCEIQRVVREKVQSQTPRPTKGRTVGSRPRQAPPQRGYDDFGEEPF